LFIITLGAEAVGGVLSVTTVDETVFVSAANKIDGAITAKRTHKEYFKNLMAIIVMKDLLFSRYTFYQP
jgi:hypothetical protein